MKHGDSSALAGDYAKFRPVTRPRNNRFIEANPLLVEAPRLGSDLQAIADLLNPSFCLRVQPIDKASESRDFFFNS